MAASVTLSSVGVSAALILDYIGAKTTTARLTLGSTTMTVNAIIQATLDSSMATGSSPNWWIASTLAISSALADTGYGLTFETPIAGLRISSTAISSSSVTLTALQNAGG
jgi:hypothetical protein